MLLNIYIHTNCFDEHPVILGLFVWDSHAHHGLPITNLCCRPYIHEQDIDLIGGFRLKLENRFNLPYQRTSRAPVYRKTKVAIKMGNKLNRSELRSVCTGTSVHEERVG